MVNLKLLLAQLEQQTGAQDKQTCAHLAASRQLPGSLSSPSELLPDLQPRAGPLLLAPLQVQEEFSIGVMGEVQRARAAEKVAAGARDLGQRTASVAGQAASAVSHQVLPFCCLTSNAQLLIP